MEKLSFDDFLNIRLFGFHQAVCLSPDGQWVAYALQRLGDSGEEVRRARDHKDAVSAPGSRLFVTNVDTGQTLFPCPPSWTSWAPSWNRDASLLAFLAAEHPEASVHLCVWEPVTGTFRRMDQASVHAGFGVDGPRWAADGIHVCIPHISRKAAASEASPDRTASVRVFESPASKDPGSAVSFGQQANVALVDATSGSVNRLTEGLPVRRVWPSPVDGSVLWTEELSRPDPNRFEFRCRVHVVASAAPDRVVAEYGRKAVLLPPPRWAPDGRSFAILNEGTVEIHSLDAATSHSEPLRLRPPQESIHGGFMAWSADGRRVLVTAGGRLWWLNADGSGATQLPVERVQGVLYDVERGSLPAGDLFVFVAAPDGKIAVWRQPEDGRAPVPFFEPEGLRVAAPPFERDFGCPASATPDGRRFVHMATPPGRHSDLWLQEPAAGTCRRVTDTNRHLDGVDLRPWIRFPFRTDDGAEAWCACLLPPAWESGKPCPAVVVFYPGAAMGSRDVDFCGGPIVPYEWLAAQGFAVVQVDVPYDHRAPHDPIDAGARAVLPAVNEAARLGYVDPNRMAVMGHSFGGYGVLCLVTRTQRFRAAICASGISNVASQYGTMYGALAGREPKTQVPNAEAGQGGMGAPPWERPLRYVTNSPVFHLDRVTTPLLLVAGSEDCTTPWLQAGEAFVGLRRLGCTCTLLVYPGEGHEPNRWAECNRRDLATRVLEWLHRHL